MEYLEKFKNYLSTSKSTPSRVTVKNYCIDVKHFIDWAKAKNNGIFDPKIISLQDIELFRQEKNQQLSHRSLDRHVSSLRKFFYSLKLEGVISASPFEKQTMSLDALAKLDPYHLKEFKDFLYVYNASHLTIKNYVIDIKQFFTWAEKLLTQEAIIPYLTSELLQKYRDELASQQTFSVTSINRKLSSLRKYISWAKSQKFFENQNGLHINPNEIANITSTHADSLPAASVNITPDAPEPFTSGVHESTYSPFPPFRLAQKISKGLNSLIDAIIFAPLAHGVKKAGKHLWVLSGKPLFSKKPLFAKREPVKNLSNHFAQQPFDYKALSFFEKVWHHARHTRPTWYKRYHENAISHYFHWAILAIVLVIVGFGFYRSFITQPTAGEKLLAAAAPGRILSFQGRLTDASNNPITTSTNLRFGIYTDATSTGSGLLWQEVDSITPDSNGVFSVLLGKNSPMQQSLFANNANLFLGISVGQTPEMTPRQQLATVAYATNAETLQGLPPITQSGAGTQNVVLALNSSGNLSIGAASTFQTVGGAFTLSGDSLVMNTNPGTSGNITIAPDGQGFIDLQKPLQNTTNNTNIPSAQGSVEVDDTFAILATNSGVAAQTINQNGSAALFTASTSGVSEFTIGNNGALQSGHYQTPGGIFYTDGTGTFAQTAAGNNLQCLTGGSTPSWASCSGIGTNYWTLTSGALYPVNTTLDVLFGGIASNAANFAFINNAPGSGTPTASIAGNLTLNSAGVIQTTRNQLLTIGGNTTGNITLSPLNGSGTVTISGLSTGVVHSTNGLLSSSAVDLANDVTGILPLTHGGTGANITGSQGGLTYFNTPTTLGTVAAAGTSGLCLLSGGTGTPTWANCATASSNWWNVNQGVLFPINSTFDLVLGSSTGATTSAKFSVLNMTGSGTPTASVSSGLNGIGTFITANGQLQTTSNQGLTIGGSSTGNITLSPLNGSGYLTINGTINASLVPQTSSYNLGSSTSPWNNVYATNLISTGTISGFWQRNSGVLSPTNIADDLAIGGAGTSSAKFQIFGLTGNATTAGTLTFTGTGSQIQTTSNQILTLGGNTTGGITLSPNNGNGTVTNLGSEVINGNVILGSNNTKTITANGEFNADLLPSATNAYNLGSSNLEWNNLYVQNIIAGGTIAGFFQRNSGVIAPLNITDDLAIGNTATGTAKFQIFGNTGNATTSGTLTFTGTGSQIQTTSNQILTLGGNTTGGITLSPNNGNGTIAFNGNVTQVGSDTFTTGTGLTTIGGNLTVNGTVQNVGNGSNYTIQTSGAGSLYLGQNAGLGNVVVQPNAGGQAAFEVIKNGSTGDIFTASASATTRFTIQQDGTLIATKYTAAGGVVYTDTTGKFFQASNASANTVLHGGTTPTFSAVDLTQDVGSSILPLTNGGTGANITGDQGGILYFDTNTTLHTLAHSGTAGYCLTSGGSSAPSWVNCSSASSNWFNMNNGTIFPINNTLDLVFGSATGATTSAKFAVLNMTGSGTPTASVSSGLNGTGTFITANGTLQTTSDQGLTIGGSSTGNITLSPLNGSGYLTINGTINASLVPSATDTYNLGSGTNEWNNLYVKNIISSGNLAGFWQRNSGVLSPTNIADDLAIGGAGTGSAKFQIFANTGNATTSGNLTFNGNGNGVIQTTNNQGLTIGGNSTGNIILAPNNGTGSVTVNGYFNSSLLPVVTNTYNLGSSSLQWNNIYGNNIYQNGQPLTQDWQRNLGVLSPLNIADDLAIGGIATGSAKFQVFGLTGNATTSGNLTFAGGSANNVIAARNNAGLTIGDSQTGNIIFNGGNVGIGTTSPTVPLEVTGGAKFDTGANITLPGGNYFQGSNGFLFLTGAGNGMSNGKVAFGYNAANEMDFTSDSKIFWTSSTNSFSSPDVGLSRGAAGKLYIGNGTGGDYTGTLIAGSVGIGTSSPVAPLQVNGAYAGNAAAIINQQNSGDIFTASSSGTAKFTIANDGTIKNSLIPNLNNTYDLGSSSLQWNNLYVNNIISGGTYGGFFQRNLGVLSPVNITDDLSIGGIATGTAKFQVFGLTGNATTSGTLTFTGTGSQIQTTSNQPLTIGGNTTGNIILAPNNGTGTVTVNGYGIQTTTSTFNAFTTTAATLGLGVTGGTTTVNSALTITGNLTPNGQLAASLIPTTTSIALGSSANYFGSAYITNVFASSASQYQGFWQLNAGVLSPTNITNDLAVGGTATSGAKFQIFANTGNATTSGNLTFNGNGTIQTTNNQPLTLGGNSTGNIVFSSNVASNILPKTTNTYDLGSLALQWNNIYANNIYQNGTAITQLWQRNSGVLSPLNITDDLAIGQVATGTAKFQIFGNTGNATTSGNLTFAGGATANLIAARNNAGLTIGDNQTGNIIFNGGNVGIGTTSPQAALDVNGSINIATNSILNFPSHANGEEIRLYDANNGIYFNSGSTGGPYIKIYDGDTSNRSFSVQGSSGTTRFSVGALNGNGYFYGNLAVGSTLIGNGAMIVNQPNGFGNIFSASSSGTTKFVITNTGSVGIGTTNPLATLDIRGNSGTTPAASASANTSYAALVINNDGIGNVLAASSSSIPVFSIQANGKIVANQYSTAGGVFYTNSAGVFQQASNASANTVLHGGTTPTFSAVDLTQDVTGNLPLNHGGTNNSLVADAGGVVYSDASGLQILTHSATVGQCLTSGGTSHPNWTSCASASSNWWNMNAGALFPINETLDLVMGSSTGATTSAKFSVLNMTGSGTPTASVSSGLNGIGTFITANGQLQTTSNQGLTIGGSSTGNITLSPLNGTTGSSIALNATNLTTNQTSVNLFTTATSLSMGAGASTTINLNATTIDNNQATVALFATPTTVNFGSSGQTTNLKGNLTLGTSSSNTVTINGVINQNILPSSTSINLGDAAHYWGTVYANNFIAPVGGGTSGYWTLGSNVLSPVNPWNDLTIGGNATSSATPWQVFATTVGVDTAGTATSSGNLAFRGGSTKINLLNGATLAVQTSVGGDGGLTSQLTLANNGDLTLNGANIISTQSTLNLFNTNVTSLNFGGAVLSANLFTSATGAIVLGNTAGTIGINSHISNNLIPDATNTRDLGTTSLEWRNLYLSGAVTANNLYLPATGGTGGYWTLNTSVLYPTNNWNDLAIGGTATGSATPFQIFANPYTNDHGTVPSGTATTSGNLTFRGTTGSVQTFAINLLNNANLSFNTSVGGDKGIASSPLLALDNNNSVNINAASDPLNWATLYVNGGFRSDNDFRFQKAAGTQYIARLDNVHGWGSQSGYDLVFQTHDDNISLFGAGGMVINNNQNNANYFQVKTVANANSLYIPANTGGGVGIGTASVGNGALVVNQANMSGLGDIFTASASGTPLFTIANDGTLRNSLIPNSTDTYNLGSDPNAGGKEWNNLYVRQIITPSTGGIAGYWQLNSGVLSPANILNDLAIGATATGSAKFQIFANTGNATTSGNLTFTGGATTNLIAARNNAGLTIGDNQTGNIIFNGGNVGIGTTSPANTLQVAGDMQVGKDTTAWGVSGYSYRRQVSITNTSGGALTNYQVKLVVDTATLIAAGKITSSACNDIRFTDQDGATNLNYWIENGCNTNYTTIWVNVPTIGYPNKTIYMYYGKSGAAAASSTTGTFVDQISGVQAAYRLDEPTYDPIVDYSTNGNVATASGTTVVTGKFGNARSFNGTSDYIAASDSASLRQATPMSLSMWFKTTTSANTVVVRKDTTTGTRYLYGFIVNETSHANTIAAQYYNGTNFETYSGTINDGNWHFAVMTISGTTMTLYIDGVAQGSPATITGTQGAPTGEFNIGAAPANTGSPRAQFFNGSIDEVRLYNVALNSTQVTELYGAGGNNYGYVSTNNPGKELVAAYSATPPTAYLNPEQSALQTIPSFYVQNATGNVALGTLSLASTSARLTVAGDIKSGLLDTTPWGTSTSSAGFSYRARVKVDNTKSATDLTNYIVQITTNTAAPIANGKMRSDCGDIRFTDADGSTNLNYWIETGTCNTSTTVINVKVPTIPGSASKNIYMYYGNPSAQTVTGPGTGTGIYAETINSIKGAWRFDETSGTSLNDYSGNGNTGTITGTVIQGGYANNARYFNGTTDNIALGNPTSLQITGALTLEAWVKSNQSSSTSYGIIAKMGSVVGAGSYGYDLRIQNNEAEFGVSSNGTAYTNVLGNTVITDGKWHHLVGVYVPSTSLKIYVDGTLQNTNSTSIPASINNTASNVMIGCTYTGLTECMNGSIDETRVYNSSLAASDVTNLYNSGKGYGYVTTNSAGNEYVRTFNNPEPVTTVDTEQDPSQVDPTLYVNNAFNQVGINTANPNATLDITSNEAANIGKSALNINTTNDGVFLTTWQRNGISLGDMYHNNNGPLIIESSANTSLGTTNVISLNPGGGYVGIGTTSPVAPLEVAGSIYASSFKDRDNPAYFIDPASSGTAGTFNGSVGIGTTNPSLAGLQVNTSAGSTTALFGSAFGIGIITNWPSIYFNGYYDSVGPKYQSTDPMGSINLDTSGNFTFDTAPSGTAGTAVTQTARLTILNGGNVGIGTTSPLIDLAVGNVNGGLFGLQKGDASPQAGYLRFGDNTGWKFIIGRTKESPGSGINTTTTGALMTVQDNGNVGIGTSGPGYKLEVNGNAMVDAGYKYYFNGTTNNYVGYGLNGDPTLAEDAGTNWLRIGGAAGVAFWGKTAPDVNNTPDMFINTSGNVGIGGTTSPNALIDARGGANCNASLTYDAAATAIFNGGAQDIAFCGAMTTGPWSASIQVRNSSNGSDPLAINPLGGNVGIGTTSPGGVLDVYGGLDTILTGNDVQFNRNNDAYISNLNTGGSSGIRVTVGGNSGSSHYCEFNVGLTGWSCSSDVRFKTNISELTNSLNNVLALRGVNFVWKDDPLQRSQIGFIAQEVEPILPDLVSTDSNGFKSVNYADFTPVLVEAIKAQQMEIATNSALLANINLTTTGDVALTAATPSADFATPHYYTLSDALGNPITQMARFAEAVIGNLRVGGIDAQDIVTHTLAIATNNVTIAGQSLHDYIAGIVASMMNTSSVVSPIASINELHTNLISPLASSSAIAIDLTGSQFTIRNSATGSAVASIDNTGNATFSGSLNAQNLAVNGDATVSGTLYADKIKANSIEGLSEIVSTLSAQNITNVTNMYFATPSSMPTYGNIAMGQSNPSSTTSGLLTPSLGYANIASYSSFLAYVPTLSADTAMFNSGLVSLGTTSLADTAITGQLSINGNLILADNSINVLGSTFQIQPLRQGGVSFEGGLLAIDTNGNLTVNGNAIFTKNLAANIISPLSNDKNLTIQLGQNPTATGAALATSTLRVQNASGSGVFAIDQLGNVVASGAASIAKLNFNLVQPALAVSDTEVIATGSAGTAVVKAHQTEVTIDNPLVTDKSLIYITPVGQSTVTPYLLRQVNGTSFTVGIPVSAFTNTTFNWLVVN